MILKESNLFEAFNFRYFGPVDGHNVFQLVRTIQDFKNIPGPKLLHIKTQKGKGFKPAEKEQTEWHAPRKFDKHTGKMISAPDYNNTAPKYQDVFGETLLELAELDSRVVGVTPAMASGSSMNILMNAMPDRVFDVGIAEQHAVTFSAGMAKDGLLPFCNIYSSFMQRAYDQVIHDVALQQVPVVFCLDRAGLVGADGATHHGMFDITFMRAIPHMIVASPIHEIELRNLLYTAYKAERPFVIRYPRGTGQFVDWKLPMEELEIGKGCCIRSGTHAAVLAFGPLGYRAYIVAEQLAKTHKLDIAVYNMRFAKPLDTKLLDEVFSQFTHIVTIEDGVRAGGFGSAIEEYAQQQHAAVSITICGLPDEFIAHGTQDELLALCGLDEKGIAETIIQTQQ
jgi:1-deoxy-D-xylulose-5-phosphate synthase